MRRRSALRTWIEYAAARIVLATLAHGPLRLSHSLAGFYVRLLDLLVPRLRRTAFQNLAMALPESTPEARQRIVEGSFRSLARLAVALARFPQIGPHNIGEWIRYEGFEHFEQVRRLGKGVLFATAHLGNWELSAFAHGWMTEPMHIVARALDNPSLDALVTRLRGLSGNRVIEKRDYARSILRALARNQAVGVLIDQNTTLDEGIFVDFFGIPACANPGLARIASHTGAAIIPGFALWSEEEGRYILKFHEPIYANGDARADTQRLHARLEEVIRQYPDQWLWMHRRWKTRPPGEPPLYG